MNTPASDNKTDRRKQELNVEYQRGGQRTVFGTCLSVRSKSLLSLSVCFSDCLSKIPSICLSICLPVRPTFRLSVCLFLRPSVRPSVCLSVCLFLIPIIYVRHSVKPSDRPFSCLFLRPIVIPNRDLTREGGSSNLI